jgi:pimeloyl-ACP methyl ester carboxylesterase
LPSSCPVEYASRACAPSLFKDFTNGVPAVPEVLQHGWVMVAPDYVGMGTKGPTPYLVGTGEAYAALDAARSAHQLAGLSLSSQTVIWRHSQGGGAALWTGHLAPTYAPQLKIDGVAALSPATDLVQLAERVQSAAAGTVVTGYMLTSFSNTYKDVRFDDYVRPGARVQVHKASERCLTDPGLAASVIAGSGGQSIFGKPLASGPLGKRLLENTPTADMGGAPLFVGQGTGDEVINIAVTKQWVRKQCSADYKLDFRTYAGRTHMGVLDADSPLTPQLTAWTADRFAGKPPPNTC